MIRDSLRGGGGTRTELSLEKIQSALSDSEAATAAPSRLLEILCPRICPVFARLRPMVTWYMSPNFEIAGLRASVAIKWLLRSGSSASADWQRSLMSSKIAFIRGETS
jgi:hypothetical protein